MEIDILVNYDADLNPVDAHIHYLPDACGNVPSGPIIVGLPTSNPIVTSATLSNEDMFRILEGDTYVNLQTSIAIDGEIAGVLNPVPTNRYLSFLPAALTADSAASTQAIRVRLASLHHPDPPTPGSLDFSAFEGEYRWVGTPEVRAEAGGPNETFTVSFLQCTPEFRDWSDVPLLLHATGSAVVPSSVYEVQYVDDTCTDLDDSGCYSDPIVITTSRWGDVVAPFAEYVGGTQPNFADITELLIKFKGLATALVMPRADISTNGSHGTPNIPNGAMNFGDINGCVGAFKGAPYPFTIGACP